MLPLAVLCGFLFGFVAAYCTALLQRARMKRRMAPLLGALWNWATSFSVSDKPTLLKRARPPKDTLEGQLLGRIHDIGTDRLLDPERW